MEIKKEYINNDVIEVGQFKKKQIILSHTGANLNDYLTKIKTRYNGKYDKIPTYLIGLDGNIIELFDPAFYSNFMEDNTIDKSAIIICLENVGWVIKDGRDNNYYDWKGHVYDGDIVQKDWRNKKTWATYSDEQMLSTLFLIKDLCDRFKILKTFVGDNIPIHKPNTFKGVICRSNYDKKYYDLSPAFDFETFDKKLNDNLKQKK